MNRNELINKLRDGLQGFNDSDLEQMMYFGLGRDLEAIVSGKSNLTHVVFELGHFTKINIQSKIE